MRRTGHERLLTLARDGHVFLIFFDDNSRLQLLDYLLDLAEDPGMPLTWQDVFAAIDVVGACSPRWTAVGSRF